MKFDIYVLLENLSRKSKFYQNPTRVTDILHKNVFTFMKISRRKWEMFRIKIVEKIKKNLHFMFNTFFRRSCPLWYVEKYGTDRQATYGNITRRMCFACWITKATDTLTEICNSTSYFSNSNITLHVHCLFYYFSKMINNINFFQPSNG
jgi:hypothetical protein